MYNTSHNSTTFYSTFAQLYTTLHHSTQLYTSLQQTIHTCSQHYIIVHNTFSPLHNIVRTKPKDITQFKFPKRINIHNLTSSCTFFKLYTNLQTLFSKQKTVQNFAPTFTKHKTFYNTLRNCAQLYNTLHNFTKLHTISQNFTTLCFNKNTSHNLTTLNNTLHNLTQLV